MTHPVFNVLFVCTGNSARSIMAEAVLRQMGAGRFNAFSAGSMPKGEVHPHAISTLQDLGFDASGVRSKSWNEFAQPGAPELHFVFTVCDRAAGEVCPVWPGQPMTAHWGVEDPAAAQGSQAQIDRKFKEVFIVLKRRIELFMALPVASLDRLSLQKQITDIGSQ